jgi:endonuclease YncB( thermonuclease family)
MAYKLIKGEFHIFYPDLPRQGPEPDGDTLKFLPTHAEHVWDLQSPGGTGPSFNGRGMINLRFEGIDALETHFRGMHQDKTWANAAKDAVLENAGFGAVKFWPDHPQKVQDVENHPRPGYILARSLDAHGRIISFVYEGDCDHDDGAEIFLGSPELDASFNANLINQGLVYACFYVTLPTDLQNRLKEKTDSAKEDALGLWPFDALKGDEGIALAGMEELQTLVMWPKLFRRLAAYFASGFFGLDDFEDWLRADPRDRDDRVLLPGGELGNIHDVIEIENGKLRMKYNSVDIVILPDDF